MLNETEQKPRPSNGKDILSINAFEISSHAFSRFQMRTGLSLIETAEQMRKRLGDALAIERHNKLKLNKKRGKESFYFQDSVDSDLVFVIDKKKRGNSYVVTTVLFPLRRKL